MLSNKGPSFVKRGSVLVDLISCAEGSGWRKIDVARKDELKALFLNGQYGMTVLGGVQLLHEEEDPDGHVLVDDGLHTVTALQELSATWDSTPDEDPSGNSWCVKLCDIFSNGLSVEFVQYPDEKPSDRLTRSEWNIAKHDVDKN